MTRARSAIGTPELVALALLMVLAATIRFATLARQSFWFDEAVTVVRVIKPGLHATLARVHQSESTPPLYYVLAWGWTNVFGTGTSGIRSLSATIGTLTVPVAWGVGRALGGPRPGLILAGLVAASPLDVWYSQEARCYALLVLLGALSFLLFVHALQQPRRSLLAGWALASALALTTHYFAAFLVLPEALWLLGRHRRRLAAFASVAAVAGVAAALAPLAQAQHHPYRLQWITLRPLRWRMVDVVASPFIGGTEAPLLRVATVGAALVAGGLLVVAPRLSRRDLAPALPGLVVGLVALAVPAGVALAGTDLLVPRNVIAVWVPLGAAVAVVLGAARAGRSGTVVAVILCAFELAVVGAVDHLPRLQRADWRGVGQVLGPADRPRAVVAPYVGLVPLQLYLPHGRRVLTPTVMRVAELDLVGWAGGGCRGGGPPGFRADGRWRVGELCVVRLRAVRPRELNGRQMMGAHVSPNPTVAVAQRSWPTGAVRAGALGRRLGGDGSSSGTPPR
ncbi:MAG: rane protein-like protein [Conexibacter sp.]|nr:rane protein-like protein [Conexibacter sp.]